MFFLYKKQESFNYMPEKIYNMIRKNFYNCDFLRKLQLYEKIFSRKFFLL